MSSNIWCMLAILHCILGVHYLQVGDRTLYNYQGVWMAVCMALAVWLDWREHHGK